MDFIAMDYETANRTRASACSVAIVVVENNRVVDDFYALIDPEVPFAPENVRIHGIDATQVKGAPNFAAMWPHIKSFFTPNRLVAAHNAPFDVSVLRRSLERYGVAVPRYQVVDTVKTSRRLLPGLENYRLNTVSAALEVPLAHHHHALADSYACARILLQESQTFGTAAWANLIKPA